MANLSSPPAPPASTSSLNPYPTSPLYYHQLEQLKMLQRQAGFGSMFDEKRDQRLNELSLLYQNPTILYTANPLLWHHLIFSLPPVFQQNGLKTDTKVPDSSPVAPKLESFNRDYILTPETPDKEEPFEIGEFSMVFYEKKI
jgi:hypothetical protein